MIVFAIVLLVLLALALLPLGVRARYDADGFSLGVKVWLFRLSLLPAKEKKEKRPKKEKKPKGEKKEPSGRETAKKGGGLDLVQAALPLLKPTLTGLKRRLTIQDLELLVTWGAENPADAAMGYGCANAALGTLWAVIDQHFKVRRSRLGCQVDFDLASPTVYADATLTIRLGQVVTLVVPAAVRFFQNAARVKRSKRQNRKEEV